MPRLLAQTELLEEILIVPEEILFIHLTFISPVGDCCKGNFIGVTVRFDGFSIRRRHWLREGTFKNANCACPPPLAKSYDVLFDVGIRRPNEKPFHIVNVRIQAVGHAPVRPVDNHIMSVAFVHTVPFVVRKDIQVQNSESFEVSCNTLVIGLVFRKFQQCRSNC